MQNEPNKDNARHRRATPIFNPHGSGEPTQQPKNAKRTQSTLPKTQICETNPIPQGRPPKNTKRTQFPPPPPAQPPKNAKRTQSHPAQLCETNPIYRPASFTPPPFLRNEPNPKRPRAKKCKTNPISGPTDKMWNIRRGGLRTKHHMLKTAFNKTNPISARQKYETNPIPIRARSRHAGMPPLCETNPITVPLASCRLSHPAFRQNEPKTQNKPNLRTTNHQLRTILYETNPIRAPLVPHAYSLVPLFQRNEPNLHPAHDQKCKTNAKRNIARRRRASTYITPRFHRRGTPASPDPSLADQKMRIQSLTSNIHSTIYNIQSQAPRFRRPKW